MLPLTLLDVPIVAKLGHNCLRLVPYANNLVLCGPDCLPGITHIETHSRRDTSLAHRNALLQTLWLVMPQMLNSGLPRPPRKLGSVPWTTIVQRGCGRDSRCRERQRKRNRHHL